ncbi:TPA: hypothetical protein ACPJ1D_000278 [Vibrio alginolyticus]|uniref:hypothetical protein n=1 Tax=Vibrio alginolyticus TaxID=663 RepID=UPI003755010D
MKKKTPALEFYRITRWKKHLKEVAQRKEAKEKRKYKLDAESTANEQAFSNQDKLHYDGARISNEFEVLCKNCKKPSKRVLRKKKVKFRVPKDFDIYENAESVLETVAYFRELALTRQINYIKVIHNSVNNCMSSEALLGIIGSEIADLREYNGDHLDMDGHIYDNPTTSTLIKSMGMPAELNDSTIIGSPPPSQRNVFWYAKDNRHFDTASLTAEDIKNETAEGCVDQLTRGLRKLLLALNPDIASELKMCLGEILDNAHEHCHRTAPTWYVRSYLNTNEEHKRHFELMVMNLGTSIAETFNILPDSSDVKADALTYVDAHRHLFSEEALLTVAALQGNVSSKKDTEHTRGQGTVRLIETFENISKDYVKLRGKGSETEKNEPIMNIISGSTVINFDGKYHSHLIEHGGGAEDVRISFNKEKSLKYPPDKASVQSMSDAYFPGVIINIRIPLNGSITPLKKTA